METLGKMPSQFYTKYVLFWLFLLVNSAVVVDLRTSLYKPNRVMKQLIGCLESANQTTSLADKITAKKYGSFYLTVKQNRCLQLQTKKVQEQIESFVKSQPP